MLAGYNVTTFIQTGDKIVRAEPVAAQWQSGNVDVLRGPWNETFFAELESFPDKKRHDDQVDALSGAFNAIVAGNWSAGFMSAGTRVSASGMRHY
jgi:predicted phage terminase large subunit-like protein